jgi:ferritin
MPAIAIPPAVLAEIQRQMNHEYGAAHAYTALAHWCADQNLKGFARYFHKQSGEERVHAQRFAGHLIDRGVLPELGALPAPKTAFTSLLEVARQAQQMERANTAGINRAYAAASKESDYPAQVALQWFVSEQVEEEAWSDEMVERVEAATPGGLSYLDRHIERILGESGGPEAEGS